MGVYQRLKQKNLRIDKMTTGPDQILSKRHDNADFQTVCLFSFVVNTFNAGRRMLNEIIKRGEREREREIKDAPLAICRRSRCLASLSLLCERAAGAY